MILGILVLIVGLVLTVLTAFVLLLEIAHYTGNLPPDLEVIVGRVQAQDLLLVTAQFALGVAALVSGIGLLLMRTWAWLLALALLGCELILQLNNYFQGHPSYGAMLIAALLVLYLNQRPIREAFHLEPKTTDLSSSIHVEAVESARVEEPLVRGSPKK